MVLGIEQHDDLVYQLRERREDGTWKRLTEEERQRRRKLAMKIFELNKKGVNV